MSEVSWTALVARRRSQRSAQPDPL